MRCTCAARILSFFPACTLSLSSLLKKSSSTTAPRLPAKRKFQGSRFERLDDAEVKIAFIIACKEII